MSKSQQARDLYQTGMAPADIARKLDCHYSVVHAALKSVKVAEQHQDAQCQVLDWSLRPKISCPSPRTVEDLRKQVDANSIAGIRAWLLSRITDQDFATAIHDVHTTKIAIVKSGIQLKFEFGRRRRIGDKVVFETNFECTPQEVRKVLFDDLQFEIEIVEYTLTHILATIII